MKIRNFKKDKEATLNVGYVSPGWPLSHFPNGIVAYIQNIIVGLDEKTKAIVFARLVEDFEANKNVINLSNFNPTKSRLQKLVNKILARIKLPYFQSVLYQRDFAFHAQNQILAIQSAEVDLDILEMEESFGLADFLIKMSKVPVVIRLHGPYFTMLSVMKLKNDTDYKLRVFYEGEAIKNSHGVTAPSLDVLQKVREYYGLGLPNAVVIPNPVPSVDEKELWKLSTTKIPSILFVGRFDLHKAGDLMLDAFRLIALQNKEVELVFVGPDRGVNLNGESIGIYNYLERFIPEDNVKRRIQFLGHCDSQTIAKLRSSSLVTVFPSRYENFPVSLLEALAAGCPTVATAVGGIKEIIVDNYNGLLAEPDSAESIAEKVLELIDDPEKMQLLSKNAIKDCTERFSPKVIAAQTVDYYRSVLARC